MGPDRTGIELATPGYAVRHASVARHVTDCATRPDCNLIVNGFSKVNKTDFESVKVKVNCRTGELGNTTLNHCR